MEVDSEAIDDDFIFYSLLYSSITVLFGMAVLSKFLTNEFRFGFRSLLSLVILFVGEPVCHFLLKGASGVAAFGLGCLVVYSVLPASHLPVGNKSVLITGCDSGFGQALVKKLDSIGMTVYAGCLYKNGPGAIELQNSCSDRLRLLQLDVTNEEEIQKAVQYVSQSVGEEGLWGLVNNAGTWYTADIEMTAEKIFRRVLEVNLFGVIRCTKAFLPFIRQAKGRIVIMSSVTGKIPVEGYGAYVVSKHAIEGYSDVLRLEMRKWGVKVSVIQPAGFRTGFVNSNIISEKKAEIWNNLDEATKVVYGEEYLNQMVKKFEASTPKFPADLTPVIRAMRSGLLSKRPREKYPVGFGAGTILTIFPVLPIWLADKLAGAMGLAVREVNPVAMQDN